MKAIAVIRQSGPHRQVKLRAPSLGCFAVAVLHDIQTKQGAWVSRFEMKAIYLKLGEPEPVLFEGSDAPRYIGAGRDCEGICPASTATRDRMIMTQIV